MKKHVWQKGVWRVILLAAVLLVVAGGYSTSAAESRYGGCGGWLYYGDTVYGAVPAQGYSCSYQFAGTAGTNIVIRMNKQRGSSLDPFVELYDPYGYRVAYDDDTGGNYNSLIRYWPYDTGTYTIVAQGYKSSGPFMLTLSAR